MSLRGFHIVFISVCLLLSVFLLVWGGLVSEQGDLASVLMVVSGIAGLVSLPFYGRYFLKKAKRINL